MTNTFLLVTAAQDSPWEETVREAVGLVHVWETRTAGLPLTGWSSLASRLMGPPRELAKATAADAASLVSREDYGMAIIDAGASDDPATLVAALRRSAPSLLLVVVTASPTWQSAREVFMAGADDYIRKSHDAPALAASLQEVLGKPR
jgi:CheY-like chemotaxis protein